MSCGVLEGKSTHSSGKIIFITFMRIGVSTVDNCHNFSLIDPFGIKTVWFSQWMKNKKGITKVGEYTDTQQLQ